MYLLDTFCVSALAECKNTLRQTKIMSEVENKLQCEITEHSANALRLFDEAKRIQWAVIHLPFFKRQNAMNQVAVLEQEAVQEAEICLALEKQLSHSARK